MKKIAFFCIPAYGHTNPTLAVVSELVRRKNEVRYYSYNSMREKIEATGAKFISCDEYDIGKELTPKDGVRISTDLAFAIDILVNTTLAMDDTIIADMALWKPDCIVADSMAMWGKLAALKTNTPFVSSTTTFAFNEHSAKVMKQSVWQLIKMLLSMPKINASIARLRKKGYPIENMLSVIKNDNETDTIVYTSPQFQPSAETFSDRYAFVGPSIRETPVVAKGGGKTLYISLGTVANDRMDFYKRCIEAFSGGELNVIMSVGGQTDIAALGAIPDNFTVMPTVDQLEVLQNADAFITHCGMNSVSEALYYKVPLILFPQTSEQSGVAYRVNELGAGVYLKAATPEALKAAVYEVLENPRYARQAQIISDGFHACGGFKAAADKIEAVANGCR